MPPSDIDRLEVRLDAHGVLQLLNTVLEHDLGAVSVQLLRSRWLDGGRAGVGLVV